MIKYFKVTAKFGHVKNHYYIEKDIPVIALNGSEAAQKVKGYPRVKKQLKYCISNCVEINSSEYNKLKRAYLNDGYFKSHNNKEQLVKCPDIKKEYLESQLKKYKKKSYEKRIMTENIIIKEMINSVIHYRC